MANLEKINELRKKHEMSWEDVARNINVSIPGLKRIVSLNSTKIETLEKISKLFDVSISYFFDEDIKEDYNTLKIKVDKLTEENNILRGDLNEFSIDKFELRENLNTLKANVYDLLEKYDYLLTDIKEFCKKNNLEIDKFISNNDNFKSINQYSKNNKKAFEKFHIEMTEGTNDMGSRSGS